MKNNLLLLLISLFILFFFGSCDMNSKTEQAVIDQSPDEVYNIKTWNKPVGRNATLLSSGIEKKGDVLSVKFTFTIDTAGSYYITALADGLEGEEFTASIDGGPIRTDKSGNTVSTKILLGENGWQSATVGTGDNVKAFPVLLKKGEHSIAFQGANIPNIVDINVDPVPDKTLFSLDDYNIEMDMLIERSKSPDIQKLIQQKANPEMQKSLTEKDNPLYDYNHYYVNDSAGTYVYRRSVYLYSGTTYTFETKQTPGSGAVDTVLYLYKDGTTGSNSYVDDDNGTGRYSKLTVPISSTGTYYVMVRAFDEYSYGVADIYKNGSRWISSAAVGGYTIYVFSVSGEYSNYFTTNRSTNVDTNDTYIWVTSGSSSYNAKVVGYNDDYNDAVDYDWGYMSRVRTDQAIYNFIVGKYQVSDIADWDIYSNCLDHKGGPMIFDPIYNFENLEPIDRIYSSEETSTYNCIAWSGGITSYRVWPPEQGSRWYDSDPLKAFDKYYSNNPSRYSGAPSFARSGAVGNIPCVDLWALAGEYTHGSVSRLAREYDGNYHGYDWESKPGDWERIFHPRNSLTGIDDGDYGEISETYYIKTRSGGKAMSEQESIDAGFTVIQEVTLAKGQQDKLSGLLAAIPQSDIAAYNSCYENWKHTWKKYTHLSNPRSYTKSAEYKKLLSTLKQAGKQSWAFAIAKHQEDGFLVISLLKDLMWENNKDLMEKAKAANEKKARANKATYEVPTLNGNWIAFTKEILDTLL